MSLDSFSSKSRVPSEETFKKIILVIKLLKKGYSLRKALKEVRLGWKTWYEYGEPLLRYLGMKMPGTKLYVRVGSIKIFRAVDIMLRLVARIEAERIVMKLYGITGLKKKKKEIRRLADELRKAWLEDIAKAILGLE